MIRIRPKVDLNMIQTFFVEKISELLSRETIDSHRLRINNPFTIIKELVDVSDDLLNNRLKNIDYVQSLCHEAVRILSGNHYLKDGVISTNYFKSLISSRQVGIQSLEKIVYSGRLILSANNEYLSALFAEISKTLDENSAAVNLDYKICTEFSIQIENLFVQLVYEGYSKLYLSRFSAAIFFGIDALDFSQRLEILKSLNNRGDEEFEVIFGLEVSQSNSLNLKDLTKKAKVITKQKRYELLRKTSDSIKTFLDENKDNLLFAIEVKSKDYYQALNTARREVLVLLDMLYLGHSNKNVYLIKNCFIVGSKNPDKSASLPTSYQLDGFYKGGRSTYKGYKARISKLEEIDVSKETINKLNSGIRYLRMGGESDEIINKFLNYWIGLEYIFSTFDANSYTVGRLRDYYKKCHSLIYLKRNLKQFHKDIKTLKLSGLIPNYDDDLSYLSENHSYEVMIEHSTSPLLRFRAEWYQKLLLDGKTMKGVIEKHQQNLEWNLTRIYRTRNEIVHNAALKDELTTLTSHLRYYLTFILNGLMDFLLNNPLDIDADKKITIEDYFLFQDITLSNLNSLNSSEIKFEHLLKFSNPLEIII